MQIKRNIDEVISLHKPPIFWKEKDLIKQQVKILNQDKTKDLIVKTSKIELMVKKNPQFSVNITTDFIISHTQ